MSENRIFRGGYIASAEEQAQSYVQDHRGVSVVSRWWEPTGEKSPVEVVDPIIWDQMFACPSRAQGAYVDSVPVPVGDMMCIRDNAGDRMFFRIDPATTIGGRRELWLIGQSECRDWTTTYRPSESLVARFR